MRLGQFRKSPYFFEYSPDFKVFRVIMQDKSNIICSTLMKNSVTQGNEKLAFSSRVTKPCELNLVLRKTAMIIRAVPFATTVGQFRKTTVRISNFFFR